MLRPIMVRPRLWSYVFVEAYHGTSPFMVLRLSDSLSALLRARRSWYVPVYGLTFLLRPIMVHPRLWSYV